MFVCNPFVDVITCAGAITCVGAGAVKGASVGVDAGAGSSVAIDQFLTFDDSTAPPRCGRCPKPLSSVSS